MSTPSNFNDHPAEFRSPGELRLVRRLPGPIERVWEFLVDSEKRARWFAGGPLEPRAGGKLQLHFRHKNLAPDEAPPAGFEQYHDPGEKMDGTVLRWEPPRVLAYTFGDESDVTFELTPDGDKVLLVLTHRARGGDIPYTTGYAAGWHTHVTLLLALLENQSRPAFWATHSVLRKLYQR